MRIQYQDTQAEWFLTQLKPNGFARAVVNLHRQEIETFMPLQKANLQTNKTPRLVPLFPGYLFVCFDPWRVGLKTVNSTYGVLRIVPGASSRMGGIPQSLIDGLQARCDAAGVIRPVADLAPGELVKITTGPFAGFIAEVDQLARSERVRLLFEVMGRTVSAEVPVETVQRVLPKGKLSAVA